MRAYERLIRYAGIHTSSKEGMGETPSTARQRNLSKVLAEEMKQLGLEDVFVDEHAYVYGVLPATDGKDKLPCVALIVHLDTIPDEDFDKNQKHRNKINSYPNVLSEHRGPNINLKIAHKRYSNQKEKEMFFEKIKRKKKTEL